ncbi:hypothetical protein [Photorhabdus hainanensis]|uniref:hypothetical protein n=1 Tax=Photorhabdus hainanensis TaxID=1004166 RepID=UPI001BD668BA|nr:hypothetical protein [Photorhabdus hainanensis]MBS9434873.1 hypothetical protein [Photorhabdus hainanensis]
MHILVFRNGTVSVGDVFCSSYGYEQTNVAFYQVVSIHGKKTIVVKQIDSEITSYKTSMSGSKKPLMNKFIGQPLKRQVKECSNVPCIRIEEYENAYKTDIGKEYYYSSWA